MSEEKLTPKRVFDIFRRINGVPRPSKHEERMIAFLKDFAEEHGLACKTDEAGNVLISAPATAGREKDPCVVLQGHMDMVCEKVKGLDFDFEKQAIESYVDGDWMRARGTTLGADDGIGVAIALAVATDPAVEHGPLECLFTRDEETGLTGAFAIQPGFMHGQMLINLDSEDEGEMFVGCAGGVNTTVTFRFRREPLPGGSLAMRLSVDKLTGGHSGDDIDKRRANANKVLARLLHAVWGASPARLIRIHGGNLHNAIPRDAEAVFAVPMEDKERVCALVNQLAADIRREFHAEEPNMEIGLGTEADERGPAIEAETARRIILALQAAHNGVLEMSQDIPGLVETSCNLANIRTGEDCVTVLSSQRSSSLSARRYMSDTFAAPFLLAGAEVAVGDGYPGWEPDTESELLRVSVEAYRRLFGREPVVRAIHAGLECGLFSEKYPGLDMISFGPTLRGVHSPDERLLIPTVRMVWDHLVEILRNIRVREAG